jgi:ATP-binding cassette subfamily G (WHITE) protein 2
MSTISNQPFAIPEDKVDLVWKDVVVSADGVTLLQGVSGHIDGGLIAVMGPSGSGKTTLLNALGCRLGEGMELSGEIRINGERYDHSKLKQYLGYVMQDDEHSPLLTVRETMELVALARLGDKLSNREISDRVEALLDQMTLRHCSDVAVGSGNSGLGAGEKKRLSVALELLMLPKVLFLDEPTSNLDSLDALQFVESLRQLVNETSCVVVCTIHQPQYKVFSLFDRLILLRAGSIIYDAPIENLTEYCEKIGKPCPPNLNPADHLMEAIELPENMSFSSTNTENANLADMMDVSRREVDLERGKGRSVKNLRVTPPFCLALYMSFKRAFMLLKRRKVQWIVNLIITLINSVLVGTVFLQIGQTPASQIKRFPAILFVVVNQATFGAVSTVQVFPSERNVVLRLRAAGSMTALPYFIGTAVAEMLFKTPFVVCFCIITYFSIGFQMSAGHFFLFLIAVSGAFWTGMAVAMAVSTVSRHASIALPLLLEVGRLFTGYYSFPVDTSPVLNWFNYLSFCYYPFLAVSYVEMNDLTLRCANGVNATGACKPVWAGQILRDRGFDDFSFGECMGIEAAYFAGCIIIAFLAVRFIKK